MKHYSKRARLRAKRVNAQPKEELARGPQAERPTPERLAHGLWTEPKGIGKNEIPVADILCDMVARLHYRQQITQAQAQAARTFQEARAAYLLEIPDIKGYKSCLSGDVPGYDDGDGDAVVIERYRKIERAVGWRGRRELVWVCDENQKPRSLDLLRMALDVIEKMR